MVSCTMIQFLIKRITDSFSEDIFLISARMEPSLDKGSVVTESGTA